MPELTPYVAALYVCAGFFGHSYTIAWRTGSRLWRSLAWLATATLHVLVIALQTDHAAARVVHAATGVTTRAPEPRLFAPIGLMGAALLVLTLHFVWLGTGDRAPTEREEQRRQQGRRFAAGSRLTRPLAAVTMPADSDAPSDEDDSA